MFKYISVTIAVLALATTFSMPAAAVEDSLEQAKIVVYRSDESNKTKRLNLRLAIDGDTVTTIKYKQAYVTTVPAGQYQLTTNLGGKEGLQINVKPGETQYVYISVKGNSSSVNAQLNAVEEQVAMLQQPSLAES
jgi:hypothetical protein